MARRSPIQPDNVPNQEVTQPARLPARRVKRTVKQQPLAEPAMTARRRAEPTAESPSPTNRSKAASQHSENTEAQVETKSQAAGRTLKSSVATPLPDAAKPHRASVAAPKAAVAAPVPADTKTAKTRKLPRAENTTPLANQKHNDIPAGSPESSKPTRVKSSGADGVAKAE